MKAALLRQPGQPLTIEDVVVDQPGPREVLIRTAAVGLCHSDLHFINGTYPAPMLPLIPGHEAAGVVEAVGRDVRLVKPGDHVITCLSVFCGHCEHCVTGRLSLCTSNETRRPKSETPRLRHVGGPVGQLLALSAFAEQMLVHEHACVAVRKDMPLDRAALIGCAVMTGYGAVAHTAQVRPGESVAVIGCGGIGLSVINSARIAGAGRIVAVDRLPGKLAMATRFGATDVVDASQGDAVASVQALTAGGVHHAFEAIGLKATVEQAWRMLRRGGTATVIGMIPPGTKIEIPGTDFLAEKRIQGCMMGSNHFTVDMPRMVDLYLQGRLELDALISQRIRLDQINEGLAELARGELARSVIVFDGVG